MIGNTVIFTFLLHSNVVCAVPRDNERENIVIFGIPPLKQVCVPKLQTANHLFKLS